GWQESADSRIGSQTADLVSRFRLAGQDHTVVVEVSSLGQPRQIRASVTRLNEIRRELPGAHPVAAAVYIGSQSARILRSNNLGFVDLSGNCYLAFENVLIEKEGKRNVRPSTRPLRSLFAPRATRVVRVLLVEPGRAWRLEELGRAAEVSLGHSHNVIKRLEELAWVERDDSQRFRLSKRTARCTSSRHTTSVCFTVPSRRAGSRSCRSHSSTPISFTTSAAGPSRPNTCGVKRWATE